MGQTNLMYINSSSQMQSTNVSSIVQNFGLLYDEKTKTYLNQHKEKLIKCGFAFFDASDFKQGMLTQTVVSVIKGKKEWNLTILTTDENQNTMKALKTIKQAYPQSAWFRLLHPLDQQRGLRQISHIKFSCLKKIDLDLQPAVIIQSIAWFQMPVVQEILISSRYTVLSAKVLAKCNFPRLRYFRFNHIYKPDFYHRSIDIEPFSRTKIQHQYLQPKDKQKWRIIACRRNLSNISHFCKLQIPKLQDFKINVLYCEFRDCTYAFSYNVHNVLKALNRKFQNKTKCVLYRSQKLYEDDCRQDILCVAELMKSPYRSVEEIQDIFANIASGRRINKIKPV